MPILYDSTSPEMMCNGKNTKSNINCSAQFLKNPFPGENAKLQLSLINGRGHFLAFDNIFRRLITLFLHKKSKFSKDNRLKPVDPVELIRPSFCHNGATKAVTNVN